MELLSKEFDKKESDYSPYVASLKTAAKQHSSLLPAHWSPQGQELLLKVTGNGVLPPQDVLMKDFTWKQECEKVNKDATLLVMTHGEDFGMIPVTDKYNCRGGNWTGAYFSIEDGEDDVACGSSCHARLEERRADLHRLQGLLDKWELPSCSVIMVL